MIGWQWHQLDHTQIISTSYHCRQITTPVPHHSLLHIYLLWKSTPITFWAVLLKRQTQLRTLHPSACGRGNCLKLVQWWSLIGLLLQLAHQGLNWAGWVLSHAGPSSQPTHQDTLATFYIDNQILVGLPWRHATNRSMKNDQPDSG